MDSLREQNINFKTKENADEFARILSQVNNHTRMVELRGHTPLEMEDVKAAEIPAMGAPAGTPVKKVSGAKKIYPNDPCPCGSGKKYKNCCGRKTK